VFVDVAAAVCAIASKAKAPNSVWLVAAMACVGFRGVGVGRLAQAVSASSRHAPRPRHTRLTGLLCVRGLQAEWGVGNMVDDGCVKTMA
jgi:hypothetical protein